MAITSVSNNLDPIYQSMINQTMTVERQPYLQFQADRDNLKVQIGVYEDVQDNLTSLHSSIKALLSTNEFYEFKLGRSTNITTSSDYNVISATASSSAIQGNYDVSVTNIARAERYASAEQSSIDLALGKTGTFWLGGTGTASASVTPTDVVTGVGNVAIDASTTELGTGTYTLETREVDGQKQFRLVDSDGKAVSISNQSSIGSYTASWQDIPDGVNTIDTKRGLNFTLDSTGTTTQTEIDYTAAGVSFEITAEDTLQDIANTINEMDQSYGREIEATIVGKQLILSAKNTGLDHTMIFSDGAGLGLAVNQTALNANFSVNGINLVRSSNKGLTDVISGVSLNLEYDANGQSATLNISDDYSEAKNLINDFVKNYNTALSHLTNKIKIEKDNDSDTYTRGPLANDYSFVGLRRDILDIASASISNTGALSYLEQLGITLEQNDEDPTKYEMKVDTSVFEEAMSTNPDDVVALLDKFMARFDSTLGQFTGDSGYLDSQIDSANDSIEALEDRMDLLDTRLTRREESLISQYAAMQAQMDQLLLQQQQLMAFFGGGGLNLFG
jgi:flagellar hook-associated protein 2